MESIISHTFQILRVFRFQRNNLRNQHSTTLKGLYRCFPDLNPRWPMGRKQRRPAGSCRLSKSFLRPLHIVKYHSTSHTKSDLLVMSGPVARSRKTFRVLDLASKTERYNVIPHLLSHTQLYRLVSRDTQSSKPKCLLLYKSINLVMCQIRVVVPRHIYLQLCGHHLDSHPSQIQMIQIVKPTR
ncbi:hypothetical protein L208DRAFT_75471 [Tricholoma matsutake]|nr:hypothetical protein L208DRAFT_75471 [Tricholoma matsutake 945]